MVLGGSEGKGQVQIQLRRRNMAKRMTVNTCQIQIQKKLLKKLSEYLLIFINISYHYL